MKTFSFLLIALVLTSPLLPAAEKQAKIMTAFEVLKEAQNQLGGKYKKALLSMESENAKLRPRYWWIRFYDEEVWLKIRAVQMIGPEMVRNILPGNIFDGGNEQFVIQQDQLKFDSDKCIAFMEKAAKENKIPLAAINARLQKPHPGETSPIWTFDWLDENDRDLGKISLSATTSRVTEIVSLKIRDPKFQKVSKKTLSEDMEGTFLGIGGDLEEFFTGKRTVDVDDEVVEPKEEKPADAKKH